VDEFQALLLGVEEDVISLQCPLLVVDSLAALTKRQHMPAQELDRFLLSTVRLCWHRILPNVFSRRFCRRRSS
jgi:hypothetical protein